jgi:hypothetical protein
MVRTEPTLVDVVVRVEVKGKVHFSNSGEPEKKEKQPVTLGRSPW